MTEGMTGAELMSIVGDSETVYKIEVESWLERMNLDAPATRAAYRLFSGVSFVQQRRRARPRHLWNRIRGRSGRALRAADGADFSCQASMSRTPRVAVIAGPDGAGKTTIAPPLLSTLFDIKTYVNADTIAQELAGLDPESASLAAGRVMLARLRELARQRADFAFETTLASRSFVPFIRTLRGYESTLLFLHLRTPELAAEQVFERVQAGGHHIPAEVIQRRYQAGLANLFKLYLSIVDHWFVWDTSLTGQPQLVASGRRDAKLEVNDPLLCRQLEEAYGT